VGEVRGSLNGAQQRAVQGNRTTLEFFALDIDLSKQESVVEDGKDSAAASLEQAAQFVIARAFRQLLKKQVANAQYAV